MTFDEFIKKYTNKGIDYDGYYGFQCVDLFRQYAKEVLNFNQLPPVPYAKDFWGIVTPDYEKIANTPTGVPKKGDVIIWNSKVGIAGHIAVFISGNVNTFNSFDQNWPAGTLCHVQNHNYTGVQGWLRPKNIDTDPLAKTIAAVKVACDEQTTNVNKISKIKYLMSLV